MTDANFVARHGLWTIDQRSAAREVERSCADLGVVRYAFADAHGVLRGKTLVGAEAARTLRRGVGVTSTMLLKDLSGRTVFPQFGAGQGGAADMVMVPDPLTFRVLPWAPHTGWLLCDLYRPDGTPHPFSTRGLMRRCVDTLASRGFTFCAGVEMEFHLLRLADGPAAPGAPPAVALLNDGYQYLTEARYDALDPILETLRTTFQGLGLPLRSLEVEFGPSQVEVTFAPTNGIAAADLTVLFRSATKQVCARHGHHASFMSRPLLPGVVSSGWHLHQSLLQEDGGNAFAGEAGFLLSPLAETWLGGLLAHARAGAVFSTPTLNGYKRYRAGAMAPDRATWAVDNRGVMVRVLGAPGDPATRLENRVGEPAANPYLYMASQIVAGLDGIDRALDPGAAAESPYEDAAKRLPRSLMEAVAVLRDEDICFHDGFGAGFVDYLVTLKEAEIARFLADVTDWEHREYFGLL